MQRKHRLLMLGGDYVARDATRDLGLDITVVLGALTRDRGLPLPTDVHTIWVDDHKNVEDVLAGLYRAGLGEGSFDAVYAYSDPVMMTAAVLGRVLGAQAIPPDVVALFRDKYLQKQRLRQAGVAVAEHAVISDIQRLPAGYELPFSRGVLKPITGTATQATYVVTDAAGVAQAAADCRDRGFSARTFVVEEFVEGEEWFADGVVSQGQVRFFSLGRYGQSCLSAVQERSPVRTFSLDPTAYKWAYDLAGPVVVAALTALGLRDGVFHMELFHQADGRVVFSECAARRGGGPIVDQIRYKFGVDLAHYGLRATVEPISEIGTRVRDGVVASTFLPLREGTVLAYPSVTELVALPDVVHARIFVPRGLRVAAATRNTFGRFGEVTVHADTEEQAQLRLAAVAAWFAQHTVVLPLNSTMREMWADPRNAGFQHAAGSD